MNHVLSLLWICVALLASSCTATKKVLGAPRLGLSPFFEQPWLAVPGGEHLPFQSVWTTPRRDVLTAGVAKTKLYIAPVTLAYLRPVNKTLPRNEVNAWGVARQEQAVARRLREEFVRAFRLSRAPRYKLVERPGPDTLTLVLAITELNPTSPRGNAVKTALSLVATPLVNLAGRVTRGNMAIEGKVIEPASKQAYFQFADNEADKLTLVSVRDYQPYGHAVNTMREWAFQFEEMTRVPAGQKVKDSAVFTLKMR